MSVDESLEQQRLSLEREMNELRERLLKAEQALNAIRNRDAGSPDFFESDKTGEGLSAETTLLQAILSHMSSGVIVCEAPSGRVIHANRMAGEIFRKPVTALTDVVEHKKYQGSHADGQSCEASEWPLTRSIRTGEVVTNEEVEFLRGDGTSRILSVTSCPVRDHEGRIIRAVMIFDDITGLKMMEEALRRSEEECRFTFDGAPIGAAIVDLDYRFELVNDALCLITGYTKAEMTSLSVSDIAFPEDIRDVITSSEQLHTGEIDHYQIEVRYIRKDGKKGWGNLHSRLLKEGDNRPLYFLMMISDITERKEAEEALRKAHDQLEQRVQERTAELLVANEDLKSYASKLQLANQELQEFAFVANHHLQEPLRKIRTLGNLIESRYADTLDATGKDYFGRMINAAARMRDLIQDLLHYLQVGIRRESFHAVDLMAPAQEAVEDLTGLIEEMGASVEIMEMPSAEVNPFLMRQLFHNLILNALKFSEGEKPVVRIYGKDSSSGNCQLFVEDNGIGFDEVYLDKIFRPFQRLHNQQAYSGTGIGLAICRKIVEYHSGSISARSIPGKGSTFIVTLPVKQRQYEQEALRADEWDMKRGGVASLDSVLEPGHNQGKDLQPSGHNILEKMRE